jgi:excisionase family DNA binding protein
MDDWLNLSEAAELLGVHPSTIRAWTDRGELPYQRTPGGHRRFRRADVEARVVTADRSQQAGAQMVVQAMIGRARLGLAEGDLSNETWYRRLSEPGRQALRPIGYRLLRLVQQALVDEPVDASQAIEIGRDYAHLGRAHGLSLVDTTHAYLYFRGLVAEAILTMALAAGAQGSADWPAMHHRAMSITDDVLLALVAESAADPAS